MSSVVKIMMNILFWQKYTGIIESEIRRMNYLLRSITLLLYITKPNWRPTWPKHRISVYRRRKEGSSGCTWRHASSSVGTSPPFFASVDGLLGVEETETLKRLAIFLDTKWKQPYSKTCGYVTSRIVITLVCATHRCIHGSLVPEHQISVHRPQWENGAGLNLFR